MSSGAVVVIVLAAGVLALVAYAITTYNRLVRLRNQFENAFSQIDIQLKRRHDLIPNVVAATKGYLTHERETLEAVIQARNRAVTMTDTARKNPGEASAMQGLAAAEGALSSVLTRFLALTEAYPDLKAERSIAELTEDLRSTENRIAFARQHYNDSATEYDNVRESFPAVVVAGPLGFTPAELLAAVTQEQERQVPKVEL